MSITIKINETPNLQHSVMNCDGKLHDKLDNFELSKFLNEHSTNLFIGKPRSGKSSLLYSLFKSPKLLRKCYHNIFAFIPTDSRSSMKDDLYNLVPQNQVF